MLKKLLGKDAFWMVNKEISRKVGVESALLLSDLISKSEYFMTEGELTKCGFFFNTSENIEDDTTLNYHSQKKAVKTLETVGFIETKLKGVPAKKHFKVNEIQIVKFLQSSSSNYDEQVHQNFTTNNNKYNNNKSIILKPSVKSENDFPREVLLTYETCLGFFPKHLHPKNNSKWLDTIDKLHRIDNIPYETICFLTRAARSDTFWSENFLSITKLRSKNKQDVPYIVVFAEKFKPKEATIGRQTADDIKANSQGW